MCFAQKEQIQGLAYLPEVMKYRKADMLGVGYTSLLDTYLSPEHYGGVELRYIGERTKWRKFPCDYFAWTTQGFISKTSPRSENGTDLSAMLNLSFGYFEMNMRPYWGRLFISLGAQADAFLGGVYNTRNGNNPAQLHTGLDIAPAVKASFLFDLFRKNMKLNYEVSAPLVGMQFSPAYGQSYYEIFSEGNYDHNICFTSLHNAASISNLLTLDIPLKRGAIRVGYLGDFRQAKLNDIKFHNFTHSFVIGYAY